MNVSNLSKILSLLLAFMLCVSTITACTVEPEDTVTDPNELKYTNALDLLENGDHTGAYTLFTELGDYKDAAKLAARFHYVPTTITDNYVDAEGKRTENATHTYNEKNLPISCVYVCGDYRHT